MVGLHRFVQYTRLGKAMRAVAQNQDAVRVVGINVDQIIALTFDWLTWRSSWLLVGM